MSTIGSNSGRYTLCPYYKWNYEARITCEDVFRRFDSEDECSAWMDMYCDNEWMKCPYAIDLNEAYERLEKGDRMALENHEIDALKSELRSLTIKLGKSQKKIERQQKKIDELRAVNRSFTNVNQNLEKQKRNYFEKWKESDNQLNEYERKIDEQLKGIVMIYEQRMAYLIDTYCPDGKLRERDVQDWAKDRAFAIVACKIDEEEIGIEGEPAWKVVFKEDAASDDGTVSGDTGDERTEEE